MTQMMPEIPGLKERLSGMEPPVQITITEMENGWSVEDTRPYLTTSKAIYCSNVEDLILTIKNVVEELED